MIGQQAPRTRLEQLLRQRHVTLEEFRKRYHRATGTDLSQRQAYRWVAGEVRRLPYPHAQAALEQLFGEPVARLLGPPYGVDAVLSARRCRGAAVERGSARADWEGQVISMSADRARDFLARIEASNVGGQTLDQLVDELRRLVTAYQQQPLPTLLGDLVDTQDRAFGLLEGRQRPEQTRDLYLIAGITCGLMAKASHDLGAPHDAMTQARAGYACADNAGHDGLRAWIRGMQALITYWSGRWEDSIRYAQLGAEAASRSRSTAGVWLASSEARSLAALNRLEDAHAALARATDGREGVQPDELDSLGGLCTFSRPRQLYYAADALAWGGETEANRTERRALEALDAYSEAPEQDRAFGDESGTRSALAVARVLLRKIDGAAEALAPVLKLPPPKRIHGIVTSVEHVRVALRAVEDSGRDAVELAGAIEGFTSERLALQG
ncbi:MAG: XRE family transcriptional regulator [Actinomycetota bacterium]|nr:XRE family transcriptional regulator [Actinomycetota bacterium]